MSSTSDLEFYDFTQRVMMNTSHNNIYRLGIFRNDKVQLEAMK